MLRINKWSLFVQTITFSTEIKGTDELWPHRVKLL